MGSNGPKPNVVIHYGPYEAHGVVKHKTQRLHGLIACLENLGYSHTLQPIPHLNRLTISMKDREIFRCDIRNLYFNMGCEGDVVTERAIAAIQEAKERIYDPSNVPQHEPKNKGTKEIHDLRRSYSSAVFKELMDTVESGEWPVVEKPETDMSLLHIDFLETSRPEDVNRSQANLWMEERFQAPQRYPASEMNLEMMADTKEVRFSEVSRDYVHNIFLFTSGVPYQTA